MIKVCTLNTTAYQKKLFKETNQDLKVHSLNTLEKFLEKLTFDINN